MSIATLPTEDTITIEINPKNFNNVKYVFKTKNGNKIGEYNNNSPATLTNQSNIARHIKQLLDPNGDIKPNRLNSKFTEIKELLQLQYENELNTIEQEILDKQQESIQRTTEKTEEAVNKLKSLKQPLLYFGSIIDWFTAGERNNILYAFTVYAGQIVLKNPVSVICLGEASSGKSHIQETALKLMPQEYIVNEKKITESALFNRAKKDNRFYDGKIVNYGDMGGSHDHDFMEESKNLMKELQSDGFLNKPLSVPDGMGGWEVKELILMGKPCLTYTTVPNHDFDDQELSRSILITPRMDNQSIFNKRNTALEFKHGRTYKMYKKYEKEAQLIPYMLLHLKELFSDITIINPYVSFIITFLSDSMYYKRDFDKFNNLLKTITALNYYNHTVYEIDGEKVMLVSIRDVQLFISLLKPYKESISSNLSPKATEILNNIRENINTWKKNIGREVMNAGITTNEYYDLQDLGLSKASVRTYMYELANKGYLRVVDRVRNMNVYDLLPDDVSSIEYDLQNINPKIYEDVGYELGEWVIDIMKHDKYIDDLDIMSFTGGVDKPRWL